MRGAKGYLRVHHARSWHVIGRRKNLHLLQDMRDIGDFTDGVSSLFQKAVPMKKQDETARRGRPSGLRDARRCFFWVGRGLERHGFGGFGRHSDSFTGPRLRALE